MLTSSKASLLKLIDLRIFYSALTVYIAIFLAPVPHAQASSDPRSTSHSELIGAGVHRADVIIADNNPHVSIENILKRFVQNGHQQLYSGTFVYLFEDQVQTFKVSRTVNEQGQILEKFIPLDDDKKDSSRVLENQYCILDNGWRYQFQAISSSFPFRINDHYHELKKHYDFRLLDDMTVAGKRTVPVIINAKDDYRYSYQLWFEPETSTLLKYKLIDHHDKKTIEQYLFTDIKWLSDAPVADEAVNENTLKTFMNCEQQFSGLDTALAKFFQMAELPEAYQPVSYRSGLVNGNSNNSKRQAHQFQFSDGLSSVSVFIEDLGNLNKNINAVVKIGPMSVAGESIGSHQVTVLGAIPVNSALQFLKSIKR